MIAGSLVAIALSLVAAPPKGFGPPTVTLEELNAYVHAGNYHRIRIEKIGRRFQATGTVEAVAAIGQWPIVELPGHLRAALQGLPNGHGIEVGQRIRFDGLIVDEGYACLQVWTYGWEKLPAEEPAKEPADASATAPPEDLPGIRFCESPSTTPVPSPYDAILRNAATAKSNEELLPKVTAADLDACARSEYRRVRREMIGLRLDADAVVYKVGEWPVVRLGEHWYAHLRSHSHSRLDLQEGDHVHVVGLICNEAYHAVTIWVERVEELPR